MYISPLYLLFSLPAVLLGLWAQWRVRAAVEKWSQVFTGRNATGAAIARTILNANGLSDVRIERVDGFLSDHYDPLSRTLRLSVANHDTPSVAAVGIAAHEAGHALQHAQGYWPLQIRSAIVPVVQFGSWLGPIVVMAGFALLSFGAGVGYDIAWLGVLLFGAVALFTVITLPVEFDASRRAKEFLRDSGMISSEEGGGVAQVLDAAALTYVAAAVSAISTLMYYVLLLSGMRRRD